jgi:hypothetical protein
MDGKGEKVAFIHAREPVDGEALLDAIRWLLCVSNSPENPESKSAGTYSDQEP